MIGCTFNTFACTYISFGTPNWIIEFGYYKMDRNVKSLRTSILSSIDSYYFDGFITNNFCPKDVFF